MDLRISFYRLNRCHPLFRRSYQMVNFSVVNKNLLNFFAQGKSVTEINFSFILTHFLCAMNDKRLVEKDVKIVLGHERNKATAADLKNDI